MLAHMVGELRDSLAVRKLKLPELEGDRDAAVRAFADLRFRRAAAERGKPTAWPTPSSFTTSAPTVRSTSTSPSTLCR